MILDFSVGLLCLAKLIDLVMKKFEYFGLAHWVALASTLVIAVLLVRLMRSGTSNTIKKNVCNTLGVLLLFSVAMDPVLTFMRWGTGQLGWKIFWNSALPFYLCDVVSIIAAFALFTRNPYLTEVTYLWGLAGTTQGLVTPTLSYHWDTLEYYNFFLQHGGVPVAAVTLVWGLKVLPQKGAFKRIVIWSWGYMLIVIAINYCIDQNYGFLNHKPSFATMLDYMGPYPYYLLTLQAVAFTLYFILLKMAPKPECNSRVNATLDLPSIS